MGAVARAVKVTLKSDPTSSLLGVQALETGIVYPFAGSVRYVEGVARDVNEGILDLARDGYGAVIGQDLYEITEVTS